MKLIKIQVMGLAALFYFGILFAVVGLIFTDPWWVFRVSMGFVAWFWILMGYLTVKSGHWRDMFDDF